MKTKRKKDIHAICEAYEEAAGHLELCAGEESDKTQKEAYKSVAATLYKTSEDVLCEEMKKPQHDPAR